MANSFESLEEYINHNHQPIMVQKKLAGQMGSYKFVINTNDHLPPHFHISMNDHQFAKYYLSGEPWISGGSKLDKIVLEWLDIGDNKNKIIQDWESIHGEIKP